MGSNPMISGTTVVGSISDSEQLVGQKVPQRKAIAAGAREQQIQLKGGVDTKFSTSKMSSIKTESPNVTPGLRGSKK